MVYYKNITNVSNRILKLLIFKGMMSKDIILNINAILI